jgi:hypothetical protein
LNLFFRPSYNDLFHYYPFNKTFMLVSSLVCMQEAGYGFTRLLTTSKISGTRRCSMSAIPMGIFLILHGLVHLLYFGQSWRLFELQPQMIWPDGSWAFSRLLGDETIRLLACVACVLAAIGFVTGGAGVLVGQSWWRPIIIGVSIFSPILYLLFWNGKMQQLANQGAVGILINFAILVVVLILQWPKVEF